MSRFNYFQNLYESMQKKSTKWMYENPLEFPREIHVELTNKCNLRCPFCPVGNDTMKRERGFMREDLFWGVCTEAVGYGAALRLIRFGEPTLHTRCFDFIKMAKSIGLMVHMNTNGVKLDVKQVLDSGLDSIKVSMHSKTAIKPLRKLMKMRGDNSKPYVTAGLTAIKKFEGEVITDNYNYAEIKDLKHGNRAPKTCWELHNRLSVNWDGKVVACCGSWDNQMYLGQLYKETLKEIWDGENLKRYREMEQKQRLNNVPLCEHCAR